METETENHDEEGSMIMVGVAAICFLAGWAIGTAETFWRKFKIMLVGRQDTK